SGALFRRHFLAHEVEKNLIRNLGEWFSACRGGDPELVPEETRTRQERPRYWDLMIAGQLGDGLREFRPFAQDFFQLGFLCFGKRVLAKLLDRQPKVH